MEIKMDVKAEDMSKKFQDWWRFSKTDVEVCHGKLQSQYTFRRHGEDTLKDKWINIYTKKSLNSSREWSYQTRIGVDLFQVKEDNCNIIVN
jgi:hypothetical protein